MFTVTVGDNTMFTREDREFCEDAWTAFGEAVCEMAKEMAESKILQAWPVTHIRLVYALNVPGVEIEYAHVTMV
jgi:hypothetical protein